MQLHFSELITFCLSLIHSPLLLMIKLELARGSKWGWKEWESGAARTESTKNALARGCLEGPDKRKAIG